MQKNYICTEYSRNIIYAFFLKTDYEFNRRKRLMTGEFLVSETNNCSCKHANDQVQGNVEI